MARPIPWFWILLALVLLVPGPAGRFLLDLLGGLTLTLLLLPLLAAGVGVIGWQILQRRLRTCPSCGTVSFGQPTCPACGTLLDPSGDARATRQKEVIDPRNVTINVEAIDVDSKPGDGQRPG
jgi:hypothetical protein